MKVLRWFAIGFFGVIALGIVFVKAGRQGGASGGEQSAMIIKASGSALHDVATGLEGA